MSLKGFEVVNRFYQVCLVLTMGIIGFLAYYHFHFGITLKDKIVEIEASEKIYNNLTKKNNNNNIYKSLSNVNITKSVKNFDKFKINYKNLKTFNNNKSQNESIQITIKKIDQSFAKLIKESKYDQIISVLKNKVDKFKEFALLNKWPTLIRISNRVKRRMKFLNPNRSKNFVLELRKIQNEISQMEKVTLSSVLKRDKKTLIVSKLANLGFELKLLNSFGSSFKKHENNILDLKREMVVWLGEIGPEISRTELELENSSNKFLIYLFGSSCLILSFMVIGFCLNNMVSKKMNRKNNLRMVELIKDVINNKDLNEYQFSNAVKNELLKIEDYIQRRINLGMYFQESIPFSSFLLDDELKVEWGNTNFVELFQLQDQKTNLKEVSWDFIQTYTNLGEANPVLDARENGISGIYQIFVLSKDRKKQTPMEMYVSPIENDGTKKIMIYFYPLANFQQTIEDQAKTMISPVSKSLNYLIEDNWDKLETEEIISEFKMGNIYNLHQKFIKLKEVIDARYLGFKEENRELENSNKDLLKNSNDIASVIEEDQEIIGNNTHSLMGFKDVIMSLVNWGEDFEYSFNERNIKIKEFISETKKMIVDHTKLLERNDNLERLLQETIAHKKSMKSLRGSVDDALMSLSKNIRLNKNESVMKELLFEVLDSFKKLELVFSKAEIINDQVPSFEKTTEISNVPEMDLQIKKDRQLQSDLIEKYKFINEDMIIKLKRIASNHKAIIKQGEKARHFIKKDSGNMIDQHFES